ncbi:BTAD domain-containing putative transcriptional regulator [Kitasatospora herbaricolor]|uniref:AfsR/SARP family transcriptional regulator n=1 Tax=Kitasatospora herbaricolor TaxID=68217 RepID=UPI0036D7D206
MSTTVTRKAGCPDERPNGDAAEVWRYGILGALEVHHGSRPAAVERPRHRAVLTWLLLHADRPVTTEQLVDAVWGENPVATARGRVHAAVSELRKTLRTGGTQPLVSRNGGYCLLTQEAAVDVVRFRQGLDGARRLACGGDPAGAASALREGLSLWRGTALAGLEAPFAEAARAHLEEERFAAQELLADLELSLGRHQELVPELGAVLDRYPTREGIAERLVLALYRSGRQTDALAVIRRVRLRLGEEYGLDPGRSIGDLENAVLRGDPALLGGPGPGTRETAAVVKGAPAGPPERRPAEPSPGTGPAQAPARDLDPSATPGPSPHSIALPFRPAQLPPTVADFAGRCAELRKLQDLLRHAADQPGEYAPRVCTVTGPGGIGKTALTLHAAHRAAAHFPDGQLHADLRGGDRVPAPPTEVLAAFLRALGVPAGAVPAEEEARAALYRSVLAHRRVLVVLDDARDVTQIRPLLPGSGRCAVVVTGRGKLAGLLGAHRLDLERLDHTEAHALFAAIVGRRRAAAEPEATAEVLAACAGLPLALRIAAARLAVRRHWTVAALAARLRDHGRTLDELQVDDLAVRTCFGTSYRRLPAPDGSGRTPDPARAFRLLGIAPGSMIGQAAAAALFDLPPRRTEAVLEQLVDVGLLESPAPGHYQLHDLLRLFAAERAAAEESQAARQAAIGRVTDWYLSSLVEADALPFPGRPRTAAPAAPLASYREDRLVADGGAGLRAAG